MIFSHSFRTIQAILLNLRLPKQVTTDRLGDFKKIKFFFSQSFDDGSLKTIRALLHLKPIQESFFASSSFWSLLTIL